VVSICDPPELIVVVSVSVVVLSGSLVGGAEIDGSVAPPSFTPELSPHAANPIEAARIINSFFIIPDFNY
jgi:hypothetical protein